MWGYIDLTAWKHATWSPPVSHMQKRLTVMSTRLYLASLFFFSFLPHFVVTCDLFLNRGTVTWSSFVNEIVITTNFPLGHTLYYRFRPFSLSWWPKINVRERISVGSDSVSSSLVNKNRYNSCYGWQRSNYNRSSMVYRWKSLSQWSEILGHGKFQTRFWNNRTKCC